MTRRVLVARLDSAGDVIVSGPAVRAIAREAEVVFLCGPRGRDAARLLPGVARILEFDAPWIADPPPAATREAADALAREVRAAGIDEAVILTSFHQSPLPLALLLRLAGVTRIAGASTDYAGSLLDVRLRPGEDLPEDIPEPERALAIANAAGFSSRDSALEAAVPTGPGLPDSAPTVVVHPGASVPARRAPLGLLVEASALLAARGWRVAATGSADERAMTAAVAAADPRGLDLGGLGDLARLARVVRGASAIVVGNTGPAHIAAAVGTPVVSLFSPVVPAERWAPHGVPREILGDQTAACRGSRARACPVPGHPCLAGIRPHQIADAVGRLAGAPREEAA